MYMYLQGSELLQIKNYVGSEWGIVDITALINFFVSRGHTGPILMH